MVTSKQQVPPSHPRQGSLGEAKEHPAISWSHQGSGTRSIQTLPSMDKSPPIFSLEPSSVCWRPLQGVLPSAGSGTHGAKSFWCGATPQVMPVLWDLLVWVHFSPGEGRTRTGAGSAAGGGYGKTNKRRRQTERAPSSSAVVSDRRKDAKFCPSPRRLLGSRKFTTLVIPIISHQRHLPGRGDHLPLPVVLGYLFRGDA